MSAARSVAILTGVRIPQARQNGVLFQTTPLTLSALVAREAVIRSGIAPERFGSVHWGMMYQTEGNSVHLAKHTALQAGLPGAVPAVLINRLCCSGLQTVVDGARLICLGETDVVLAGSVDCMSRSSSLSLVANRMLGTPCSGENPVMASTLDEHTGKRIAELVDCFARNHGITRREMNSFAFQSRERARMAQGEGVFKSEIVPVPFHLLSSPGSATTDLQQDQLDGRWPTCASLERLESPYGEHGRVTRGNVSTFADGAAAVVLANQAFAQKHGYRGLARIRSWAICASDAEQIGEALVSSVRLLLKRSGVAISEIDWFDFEEAFAANCVYAAKRLSLAPEKINPCGGALALGHPPATSGLRQLLCAAYALHKNGGKLALIGVSAGGSQAVSMLIERLN